MTITTSGKTKVIELIESELTNGECGTSTQAPAASDTGLIIELTSTIQTISGTQSGQQLLITYNLDSTKGNGNNLAEYGNFFTTSETLFNRITFVPLPKTAAFELQVVSVINLN
jgi:hypothetical protein